MGVTPAADSVVDARIGLLGNPSDGYGGRVIACTVAELRCRVHATPSERWRLVGADEMLEAEIAHELGGSTTSGGSELLATTVLELCDRRPELVREPVELSFETTIPRQVGLAGSSAIIIGALRSIAGLRGHHWDPIELARTATTVEVGRLGWAAGPQDRVVQAHGGLLDMGFDVPWNASSYVRLDPGLLPAVFLAWDRRGGASSDVVHSDVRARWLDGDPEVVASMRRFAALAAQGRHALDLGETARWPALLDEAFELRARLWRIGDRDLELVRIARDHDAGASFAGSGGAVVGVLRDQVDLDALRTAYDAADAGFLVPTVGQAAR